MTATTGRLVGPPAPVGVEQLEAVLAPLAETSTLRLSAEGRSLRGLRLTAQRALFRVLRPLWFQQHQFHAQIVAALRLTAGALRTEQLARETVDTRVRELTRKVLSTRHETQRLGRAVERLGQGAGQALVPRDSVEDELASVKSLVTSATSRADALATAITELQGATGEFQSRAAEHLEALTAAAQESQASMATLSSKLFAVPYMTDPSRFLAKDERGRTRLGYRVEPGRAQDGFYVGFEATFRGPEALIRDRQRVYLPILGQRSSVVDLGCGRGEMLDLLKEAGVPARGVDLDPDMVRSCRDKGHSVDQMDALEFLREQAPASLSAVFSAQVIEHLRFAELKELLELCRGRLRPGGVFVAETVNPHALEAFKTFYTDLTHERPIFPEVALSLFQLAGFEEAYVVFPLGTGDLDSDRRSQGEYAVVATAS